MILQAAAAPLSTVGITEEPAAAAAIASPIRPPKASAITSIFVTIMTGSIHLMSAPDISSQDK